MTNEELINEIKCCNTFAIFAHVNPDGDAVASCLGFCAFLKTLGKEEIDVLYEEIPAQFESLPNSNYIKKDSTHNVYDMAIVLDCPNIDRVSKKYKDVLDNAKEIIEFDHHLNNTMFGTYNLVDPDSPACSEVLVTFLEDLGLDIDKNMATCFLTGIITDTGGFKFNSTTQRSFKFAAWCLDKGLNVSKIYKNAFSTKTYTQFKAESLALSRMEFLENGKITFTYITNEEKESLGVKVGELDTIVDMSLEIKGVEISIFAHGKEDGFKMSFRSNGNIDVSKICEKFDGGGHKAAAGCTIKRSIDEVKELAVNETKKYLNEG